MSDTPMPALKVPRRFRNRSNGVAKLEVRLEAGAEIEVPDGAIVDGDRQPLDTVDKPVKAPAKKAPAKKAPAKS